MNTKALVVDDSYSMQFILGDILRILKIENIIFADNGLDAAEKYRKHKPELVLLDVMMPEYDGLYALKEIKKSDPKATVIMVTATEDLKIIGKMKKLGIFDIVRKPFEIEKISKIIEKAIEKSL